ncbi:MAG: PEP-CTERM sorting domain-containing protein [Marinobacter sp.]|uniref:PEP-CTERM sorting domain-containing protein n=1 Tax=Marinobacter sp. TaxID=50741 RepID=UPI00299F1FC7|nr:PEP-CTERM sorting domain-containing protein [Marinobacter sp.]MDX1633084.1 PEP-CTERM sorting domain-containing protein [Marinobacter sp.]
MKHLITGFMVSIISTGAFAGTIAQPPVSVPEPGMLGLFAAGLTALFLAKKFRK